MKSYLDGPVVDAGFAVAVLLLPAAPAVLGATPILGVGVALRRDIRSLNGELCAATAVGAVQPGALVSRLGRRGLQWLVLSGRRFAPVLQDFIRRN